MIKKIFPKESASYLIAGLVAIKILGMLFATNIFARYSPLIDSNLYLSNFYSTDPILRTKIVQALANSIVGIAGDFCTHLFFGFISVAGFFYYYLRGGKSYLILLFLLLPSSLIWTSIVGKEALFFGGMGLCLFIWAKFSVETLDVYDWAGLIIGLSMCLIMRPHYGIVLVWLFASTALVRYCERWAIPLLLMSYFGVGLVIYCSVWDELLRRGFGAIEFSARASRFDFFGIDPQTSMGFEKFKNLMPLAVIIGIIGPLPSEMTSRLEFTPFFIEGVLILVFPIMIALFAYKKTFEYKTIFFRIFWTCLLPGIFYLMVIHAPFGILNPGSATRWRTDFEQFFYLAPSLLYLRCISEKK